MGTVNSETVRGEYVGGTGFEAGNVAPSTKYIDEDGKVTDEQPAGVARVLVEKGDVVRPHMVAALEAGRSETVGMRYDNEHSTGDASHGADREPLDVDDDDSADDAPAEKPAARKGRRS